MSCSEMSWDKKSNPGEIIMKRKVTVGLDRMLNHRAIWEPLQLQLEGRS